MWALVALLGCGSEPVVPCAAGTARIASGACVPVRGTSEPVPDTADTAVPEDTGLEPISGPAGGSLLDETVVVVFSEMGCHPLLNVDLGKDHWTVTSAMLIGSGVAGGRSYGGYGEDFEGAPIVPSTGKVHDSGVSMVASHLGATLLALGDVDPGPFLPGIEPITALIAD
jgi:hypothetical protein